MFNAKIKSVETEGYAWIIAFKPKGKGFGHITFSEEAFAELYETESGEEFYTACNSRKEIDSIRKYFKGKSVVIGLDD